MIKISIFIDGNNFYYGLKKIYLNSKDLSKFNFSKFIEYLKKDREIISIYYYNAPLDRTKNLVKYQNQQKFFDKLRKIPKLNVVLCKLLKRKVESKEIYVLKGDDIHLAVDMVKDAYKNHFDTAILVSGDGDFFPAVNALKEKGKKVENIYFKPSSSSHLKHISTSSFRLTKEILNQFFDN